MHLVVHIEVPPMVRIHYLQSLKSLLQMIHEDRLECCINRISLSIGQMRDGSKANLLAQGEEEWNIVNEEYIGPNRDDAM